MEVSVFFYERLAIFKYKKIHTLKGVVLRSGSKMLPTAHGSPNALPPLWNWRIAHSNLQPLSVIFQMGMGGF